MFQGMRIPVLKTTCSIFLLSISQAALSQTVYTFTTAGAEGPTGPSQAAIDSAYSSTSLAGAVTSTDGIQVWDVPFTGVYTVEAFGAQGYGDFGGRGAHITGEFNLTAGTTLKILVGQKAPPYLAFPATTYDKQFGGGGGSFVVIKDGGPVAPYASYTDDVPLIIAGGGGGSHADSFLAGADGQITEAGASAPLGNILFSGGSPGLGGYGDKADGGGGFLGDGGGIAGGIAFINGGAGGFDEGFGGFGGGGGTSSWNNSRGGGGGGYSGGGGGEYYQSACCAAGGGGGSFNGGVNPVNIAGVQLGDGVVRITQMAPDFAQTFSPSLIEAGAVSTLAFTINNTQAVEATALNFTDNLPAGLVVATPANASTTCTGGTLTATGGTGTISYTDGSVGAGASCAVAVDVSAMAAGDYINVTGELTSLPNGSGGTATATLTVIGAPATPDAPTATAGNAQANVSWSKPVDNGSTITGYTVTSTPGGEICTTSNADTLTCDVTGLSNGTAYTFTVTATNSIGTSAASAASNSVTPAFPVSDSLSEVFASASSVQAGSETILTVVVRDTAGNPVTETPVTVVVENASIDAGAVTIVSSPTSTNADGEAVFAVVSAVPQTVQFRASFNPDLFISVTWTALPVPTLSPLMLGVLGLMLAALGGFPIRQRQRAERQGSGL